MIDVEVDVFDYVYPSVAPLVPEGCFQSVYTPSPSAFPFATLMEMDNQSDANHMSTAMNEEYAVITYEANVYAMDKIQCREVMNALDTAMTQLNFRRLSMQFVPNLANAIIYRIVARYRAVADANKSIHRG